MAKIFSFRPGTFRWAICERCEGNGSHDHPAFSNGISSDEWAEWDADERESYMHGRYDVPCSECGGAGKVQEPLPGHLSFGELRLIAEERRRTHARAEIDREARAEQRHCGYDC